MRVKDFYSSACKDKRFFNALSGASRNSNFTKYIPMLCESLSTGNYLIKARKYFEEHYLPSFFYFSWQRELAIKDDLAKCSRFVKWLGEYTVLESNKEVSLGVVGDTSLSEVVSLVVQRNGRTEGIIISTGKCTLSLKGKSKHTNSRYDLYALVAKAALEKQYPGITIIHVFLSNEEDTDGNILPNFIVSSTRKTNVIVHDFDEYYRGGTFCEREIIEVIQEVISTPLAKDCFGCPHYALCNATPIESAPPVEKEESKGEYTLPSFTDAQQEIIRAINGPVMVLAGPGSGKTATLVGRIKYLLDSGIEPEFILGITFTRDAAGELKDRVSSFTSDMPYISTIHSLCYDILKHNEDLIGKKNLLTEKERAEIIKGILELFPSLKGFKATVLEGRNGLIKTVERKLDKYLSSKDKELFFKEEPDLGNDFVEFADIYSELCSKKGYITFTEQISHCIALFKQYPDINRMYANLFKYIMVDEFQDIDAMQAEFISMLAMHRNLCVVGDDDQSIYGFRGGSNKYMLSFNKVYPDAKVFRLTENFRSTKALVKASSELISENKERLDKEITCGRNEEGIDPKVIPLADIEKAVDECMKNGVAYKDIAILSTKNSTLDNLHKSLTVPTVLDKAYLINSPLFGIVKDVLSVILSGFEDSVSVYHLLRLFGYSEIDSDYPFGTNYLSYILEKQGYPMDFSSAFYNSMGQSPLEKGLRVIAENVRFLRDMDISPELFVSNMALSLNLEDDPAYDALLELIESENVTNIHSLLETMQSMYLYSDESRLDVSGVNAIHLITNHDSKGREFPVVFIVDDFGKDVTEETRRLLYVAMTRAKERLFLCSDGQGIVSRLIAS